MSMICVIAIAGTSSWRMGVYFRIEIMEINKMSKLET